MLRRITRLVGSRLFALDGEVGKVHDVYFDDAHWVLRYLVVTTGGWLSGRKVLISPRAVAMIYPELRSIALSLTRERVERSPPIDTDKPVSRQHESELNRYYGYSIHGSASLPWGNGPLPPAAGPSASDFLELEERRRADEPNEADSHLRSTNEVEGYCISATDEKVGHVEDFLYDDETWALKYFVVDTGPWLFGRRVLVTRDCVRQVDWGSRSVSVRRTREEIKQGLEFDLDNPPPGDIEEALASERRGVESDGPGANSSHPHE
jgi:hypothetical protein